MLDTNLIQFLKNKLLVNFMKNSLIMKIFKKYNTNYFSNLKIKKKLCAD